MRATVAASQMHSMVFTPSHYSLKLKLNCLIDPEGRRARVCVRMRGCVRVNPTVTPTTQEGGPEEPPHT